MEVSNQGLPARNVVQTIAIYNEKIFAGTLGAGIYVSSDDAAHWYDYNDEQTRGDDVLSIVVRDGKTVYIGTRSGKILATGL
jgi:hypothetical protein